MHCFDLSFANPAENLAGDEALLNRGEAEGGEALRFWESPVPFVVLGYGNRAATEADLAACEAAAVPVLRRCSGGGTVLQGPGCLNYALVLDLARDAALGTVSGANAYILQRVAAALSRSLGEPVQRCGDTDLVWRGRKCSGNAQRRRRTHLLFHGTVLLALNQPLMDRCLKFPSRTPAYRQARSHAEFVSPLPLTADTVKQALRAVWGAVAAPTSWPAEESARLVRDCYSQADWNLRL